MANDQTVVPLQSKTGYPIQVGQGKNQNCIEFDDALTPSGDAGTAISTSPVALTIDPSQLIDSNGKPYVVAGVVLQPIGVAAQFHYTDDPTEGFYPVADASEYVWFPSQNPTLYVSTASGSGTLAYEVTVMRGN